MLSNNRASFYSDEVFTEPGHNLFDSLKFKQQKQSTPQRRAQQKQERQQPTSQQTAHQKQEKGYYIKRINDQLVECIPMENLKRRQKVKWITNFFAVMSILDALASFPLIILCLRDDVFTQIASLFACMEIACFLFLSIFTGWFLIRSTSFDDRIDVIGAWVVVHFLNLFANTCFVFFQCYEDTYVLWEISILLTALMGWKIYFALIEIISCLYCFYISHNPVQFYKVSSKRTRHPLFLDHDQSHVNSIQNTNEQNTLESTTHAHDNPTNISTAPRATSHTDGQQSHLSNQLRRPISVISNDVTPLHNDGARYASYLSLAQNNDTRYVRNPAFESELSLDYANNYSPYDQMVYANRSRLSYAERLVETSDQRPYLHNGNMSNRTSYVSESHDLDRYGNVVDEIEEKQHRMSMSKDNNNRASSHF